MTSLVPTFVAASTAPVLPRVGSANETLEWIVLAVLFSVVVTWLTWRIPSDRDRSWLPAFIGWAWVAKMVGSLARYYMVAFLYAGGDAFGYHFQGTFFAKIWRALEVPVSTAGGEGTAFTEVATGLVYALYTPNMVGGFLMFAFISFIGQLLFYSAFRPWFSGHQLKLYAVAVFFLPSVVFWPSSLGKDALMTLFLGLAAYGASRLLRTYDFSSLLFLGPGLFLASRVRPHVAALLAVSIVLAAILGKTPKPARRSPKRLILIGMAGVGVAFSLASFSTTFGVTLSGGGGTQDPTAFLDLVSSRTAQGGSEITGGAVGSVSQLPGAVVTVLFRPLLHEAGDLQNLLSAMEGTALLLITIWKVPEMWRNRRQLREKPMLLLAFLYTGGFIVAFSAILNLGIIARQRVQVLPFFLAALIGLGWHRMPAESSSETAPKALGMSARTVQGAPEAFGTDLVPSTRTSGMATNVMTITPVIAEDQDSRASSPNTQIT